MGDHLLLLQRKNHLQISKNQLKQRNKNKEHLTNRLELALVYFEVQNLNHF